MKDAIFATLTGTAVGALFAVMRLPIPAPPAIAGVLGVVGLWLGYKIGSR